MSKERRNSALSRAIQQAIGSERQLGCLEDPARTEWPHLWEWLSTVYVGRDHVKQPAILTMRLGPECAIVTLTDRDLGVSVDASAPSIGQLLAALETALAGNTVALKSWGKKEPSLRKRKAGI